MNLRVHGVIDTTLFKPHSSNYTQYIVVVGIVFWPSEGHLISQLIIVLLRFFLRPIQDTPMREICTLVELLNSRSCPDTSRVQTGFLATSNGTT
ncbi:hypothetical protein KY285_004564 [Solanum tuberosum]|nr:hypothetical protein KY285_004564 [Solanum tuberosum]